jgi:succinoglycan biosynthesis transport protein ExoP
MRQIVTEAVFRRRRIFLLTIYLIVGAVLVLSLLMHKKYEAQAKLIVQNMRAQAPLTTSPSEHLVQPNDVSTTEINNEVDLLTSTGVARRALGMDPSASSTPEEDKKIRTLEGHLKVEPVHQSSVINVSIIDNSPEAATALLQKLIDGYFAARAEAARSSGAAEFFDQQVQEKGRQLDADQQDLTNFEVSHQISDLDDQIKLQTQRVAGLQDQLAQADDMLARQQSSKSAQIRELQVTPQRSRTTVRTVTNQYSQERLNTELVDLENRRTELLKRYPPGDRQVVEIDEKIATTQRAVAAAAQNPAGETATDVNPIYQQLSSAIAISTSEVSGTQAARAQLADQVLAAKNRLQELEQATTGYDALKRKLSQAQADYAVYSQKRDEERIADALDKAKMFDVALVQPPLSSPVPVRPKPILYLAAALAFAIFLGTFLAVYADTASAQVHTPARLDALTGMRTIATFADEDDADGASEANSVEYRRVLVAIRGGLGADPDGTGASAQYAPVRGVDGVEGATGWAAAMNPASRRFSAAAGSGHDEAVAQALGKPAGYVVAFVSSLSGEGVSFLVSHLATEAARQASSRIAVMDMAKLLKHFQADEDVSFGLKYDAARMCWVMVTNGELGPRPPQGGSLQGEFSARLRPLLIEARKQFDFILMDCPSLQASTLASELAICVDGYVGVVGAGKARRQNLEQLQAVLTATHAPLLGYVLNRRRYAVPGWLHRLIW